MENYLVIESLCTIYWKQLWFILVWLWDWEICSEANLNSYQSLQKYKAFILVCWIFHFIAPWIDSWIGVLYSFIEVHMISWCLGWCLIDVFWIINYPEFELLLLCSWSRCLSQNYVIGDQWNACTGLNPLSMHHIRWWSGYNSQHWVTPLQDTEPHRPT